MDKLTVIRSVDCSASNHTPITMQAGNPLARRTDDGKDGGGYPSMGSVAAKFRGPNDPAMPAFVGLADRGRPTSGAPGTWASAYEPVKGNELAGRFALPAGRRRRRDSRTAPSSAGSSTGSSATSTPASRWRRRTATPSMALDMVVSAKVRQAFDLDAGDPTAARRLRPRSASARRRCWPAGWSRPGTTFVLVSGAWGYFDHHGDNVRRGAASRRG